MRTLSLVARRTLGPALLLATACAEIFGPGGGSGGPPALITELPRALTASERMVIEASNRFGGELLRSLNASSPDENIFISPLSASMALGMTMNGAAGETFNEMRRTLGFPAAATPAEMNASYRDLIALLRGLDRRVEFRIANSIWYRDTFGSAIAPSFLADARAFFDARVSGLDFAAPAAVPTINDWAKEATNGRIAHVVQSLSPDHMMVLMNAIYFKGDWRDGFKADATRERPFTPRTGAARDVPTMHRTGEMRAGAIDGRLLVDLGYGGDAFSMTVVLPRPGEGVGAMIDALGPEFWGAIPTLAPQEVSLALPRFRLEWDRVLNQTLAALGMPSAFDESRADFSRLSPSVALLISKVVQNTFVDVNEKGTEAAAVTTVTVGVTSVPSRLDVRVDRPFVFLLRERLSGTVLFLGVINTLGT